jgi:membrane associated rhomboid family serine protease
MNQNYYRPRPVWGQQFATTVIGRLILINVVVFIIQNVFPVFNAIFALRPRIVVEHFFVWQLVTYMFMHGSLMHLLFNMLMLWLFGSTMESVWGGRHFLRYYLFCGIGGAVFGMVFSYDALIVGASGAIFGLYIAYALMFPDSYIYLWMLFPVKAKYLIGGLAIFQLVAGIAGPSGVAYSAHLGGMAAGLLFFRGELLKRARFKVGPQRRWKAYQEDRRQRAEDQETDNIDSILDKISAKGYDNLSTTEKRILENYSRKRKEENE